MASLLPSGGGSGMVSVPAPCRMSIRGQSTSACCVLTTGRGSCAPPAVEKKFSILSLSELELGDAAAVSGGGAAAAVARAGGGGGGGSAVAVAAGPPNMPLLPPEHPGKTHASASSATTGARSNNTLGLDRDILRFIAESIFPIPDLGKTSCSVQSAMPSIL